jgi:hypothetical protein
MSDRESSQSEQNAENSPAHDSNLSPNPGPNLILLYSLIALALAVAIGLALMIVIPFSHRR